MKNEITTFNDDFNKSCFRTPEKTAMKKIGPNIPCFLLLVLLLSACNSKGPDLEKTTAASAEKTAYALVIHGGAGTLLKSEMTPEQEAAYLQVLNASLDAGEKTLQEGGSALSAVEKVIALMEDSPLFNAGVGAVFTHDGLVEHDASVMDGSSGKAGALAGVRTIKNPIRAAIAVMEQSNHVLLSGRGAEQFARSVGLDTVANTHFHTEKRRQALEKAKAAEAGTGLLSSPLTDGKFGTVGCVALDQSGNIAAGTSTGGMTNKRWGRVGDSPIIGAGTWADSEVCGVSCTGHGEFFIRQTVARDVAARMEYLGESLEEAAGFVVHHKLVEAGGEGGLIALDNKGNVTMPFNSEGMYRGYARPGERKVMIYKD
jgi:beta-aspartyl-peptidase (threonine type)